MTGTENRGTYISGYWREFTGRDPEKALGFAWIEALHPDDREHVVRSLKEASQSLTACPGDGERARLIGAHVAITSAPLQGTTVELSLPMAILNRGVQISDGMPPSGV